MLKFIALSSSRGTTFKAILERIADGSLDATCLALVTDRADRGCIDIAKAANIPVYIVEHGEGEDRDTYDTRLHKTLRTICEDKRTDPHMVILTALGWMFIFTPWFIHEWHNRIINVHPALLPRHGGEGMFGKRVHESVLSAGDIESGITIHLMDEGVDTGKILHQEKCSVAPGDTPESLKIRVQELEKEWYPKVLQMIATNQIALTD